jgi:hypothetical protein
MKTNQVFIKQAVELLIMRYYIIFALMLLIFGCIDDGITPSPSTNITSFEECVDAGYPILESYPRQCRTPDGKNFISGTDFLEVNQNKTCKSDTECKLVDKSLGFGCCFAGACAQINYSDNKWIGLNKQWFDQIQNKYCPGAVDCGPAPLCAVRVLDTNFTASCINNQCTKVPIKAEENMSANLTLPNITINETTTPNQTEINETSPLSGIPFGDGTYLLVLEDISIIDNCALMAVHFALNQSEITKLKGCEGKDVNWISPEGRIFRIKVLKTAAGYTKNENWVQIQIYG